MDTQIIVVGSGVIGLTTAISFQENGFKTTLITSQPWDKTTSAQAGALWHPFLVAPSDRVFKWSMESYQKYLHLHENGQGGIKIRKLTEYFDKKMDKLWWIDGLPNVVRHDALSLPNEFLDAYSLDVPLIEPSLFLPYLFDRFVQSGGSFKLKTVSKLEDLVMKSNFVVNCTGLASKDLCSDDQLFPISGQTVSVSQNCEINSCSIDDTRAEQGYPTYVFARSGDILLGGFAMRDEKFAGENAERTEDIFKRCSALVPQLKECQILKAQGGDRPGRKQIRLEVDFDNPRIIHNYGHSGSGFTLCWGCAREVLEITRSQIVSLH